MKLTSFTAGNATEAVRLVQKNLGPDAVIVSVRKLPGTGLARLLHRGEQIEVTAGVPEPAVVRPTVTASGETYVPYADKVEAAENYPPRLPYRWRSVTWLESLGLLPEYAERLEQKIISQRGSQPPANPVEEWSAVRDTLATFWRPPPPAATGTGRPHVFVGPGGSGKTTVLCKWMTSAVLKGEQRARVWRLDGEMANTSESLSLQCEMLGVPVERFWSEGGGDAPAAEAGVEDLWFVDLPGVETNSVRSMAVLRDVLFSLPQPHVHLVLNAAYETTLLFEQFNAFAPLMPEDVIFTHLDEEQRRVKLWNFVLGTNCSLSWLAGGQKIPGDFRRADSSLLFPNKNQR